MSALYRPPFPAVVDNTMLNTFRGCPRKAELSYIEHWKYKGKSVHLHAGAAWAHGLEAIRQGFFDNGQSQDDSIALGVRALLDFYGSFECPPESAKSAERLVEALDYYFEAFPLETDAARPIKLPSGKHAIEFSFAEPLDFTNPETGDPVIYCGRTDFIAELNNGLYIADDKTTSALGSSWYNQWEMRGQFSGYAWAGKKAGFPVDGVLVRGIAILKTKFNHAQHITYRPQWEIDRWYAQTLRDLKRLQDMWERGEYDYNLGETCAEYGGCQFSRVCKSPEPMEWLPAYFERRRWDPLTRTETLLEVE